MNGRRQRQFAAVCALVLVPAYGFAQSGSGSIADQEAAREAVAGLASESWPDRIAASEALIDLARTLNPEVALATLESALLEWMADRGSSPDGEGDRAEVLARFELAAIEAFFNAPRAGLGITYDRTPASRGVRLGDTVADFDAHGKLRAGDVVLSLSGAPVDAGGMDLPVSIASHLPGEEAIISLLRNGEPMEIAVELGRRQDLRSVAPLQEPVLRRAWSLRMDRLRGESTQDKLDTDRARSVLVAPPAGPPARVRVSQADFSLGGQPGHQAARRVGVVARAMPSNDAENTVRSELDRLNGELAIVVQRALAIEESVRQLQLELRVVPDTIEGRAYAEKLRSQALSLRQELAPLQQEQRRLMQERVRLLQLLGQ